jgi:hypothetical protein
VSARKLKKLLLYLFILAGLAQGCSERSADEPFKVSVYSGSYMNIEFSESLIGNFETGVYKEKDIPEALRNLRYGRLEIDFNYEGGGLDYFMPLIYYGSVNKNKSDDFVEEPEFHLAIEIGHYNVIPFQVEYLFYTISTFRQPLYCRDTFFPAVTGRNCTFIVDKRPDGLILQLRSGTSILNVFPHAFFPDSSQMFFCDVTSHINQNRGDSLESVLMVGKGFSGFDKGIHDFNGTVSKVRFYEYSVTKPVADYAIWRVKSQNAANTLLNYSVHDIRSGGDKFLKLQYSFYPFKFGNGELIPDGEMKTGESELIKNNSLLTHILTEKEIGLYKINISTLDKEGRIVRQSAQPFEVWIYPEEWDFEF